MSMLQTTTEHSPSGNIHCSRCNAALPPHAIFCSSCGERVGKEKKDASPAQDGTDGASRYRITSLVRQRPYVKLFFATDKQQQRTVVMRNIDSSSLDDEAQARANVSVQNEYDLLRQQGIAHVMPVLDLQNSRNHLLTITGQPLPPQGTATKKDMSTRLRTLQDVVQSSTGLPSQQVAAAWISRLCLSVESLHTHRIIIGDLDPQAILVSGDDYQGQPLLMVSWLPSQLRTLFPQITSGQGGAGSALATSFSAPEVASGNVEPASDVYSLGAILYLLLTGSAPGEPMQRTQRRLRPPREVNSRINSGLDEIVMRALSLEPAERFASVKELVEALSNRAIAQAAKAYTIPPRPVQNGHDSQRQEYIADIETISFTALQEADLLLWQARREEMPDGRMRAASAPQVEFPIPAPGKEPEVAETIPPLAPSVEEPDILETTLPIPHLAEDVVSAQDESELLTDDSGEASERTVMSLVQHFTEQVASILPALPRLPKRITAVLPSIPGMLQQQVQTATPSQEAKSLDADTSFLKHIQRIVIGQRQQTVVAAATIENPLRVQPDQSFSIRIRLMGRDEPGVGSAPPPVGLRRGSRPKGGLRFAGLSGYVRDERVYVEVRSAIHQNYAYLVQQADVTIPPLGYVAEVVIPMPAFGNKSNGRRERLHVFFLDVTHRPLYERPFVLEILVSHLVQPGREGHHVLPIPQ